MLVVSIFLIVISPSKISRFKTMLKITREAVTSKEIMNALKLKDRESFYNTYLKPAIKEGYIKSQIDWAKRQKAKIPPNCKNEAYYKGLGFCEPDFICKKIKNPLGYIIKKKKIEEIKMKNDKKKNLS